MHDSPHYRTHTTKNEAAKIKKLTHPVIHPIVLTWNGGREADCACLEYRIGRKSNEGSNPSRSANLRCEKYVGCQKPVKNGQNTGASKTPVTEEALSPTAGE